ncbi:fibrobacter succinogenes major paralogous domain-containing protein [Fibrobacter succinogenes]|uniref:fibrobacter succinogenes major paralogous domain-containing protein n=1 Tax=Fibrobacter succinogenes TaxID=833 RepID=UPI0015688E10|nr:fibrobacter succinogenes major paralogous domain-containing protein [Fibrobacter succinogenes]
MHFTFHSSFTLAALTFLLTSCSESFTDPRDGQSYDVVKIGSLTWMAENLNYETETSACPDGDSRNCKRLGQLYTWVDAKTVCPEGWRLPTNEDFAQILAQSHDGEPGVVSNETGAKLKSRNGWFKKGNGTDEFGFNALPAGYRSAVLKADDGTIAGGKFDGIGGYAYFWSATEDTENSESNAFYLFLSFSSDAASLNAFAKEDFRSVRCVR